MSNDSVCETLVVIVRGWGPSGELKASFLDELSGLLPARSMVLQPDLDTGFLSTQDPLHLEQQVLDFVGGSVSKYCPGKILLMGFGTGCLLVRGTLLRALDSGAVWLPQLDRVIYAGGILRGWSITTATPSKIRLIVPLIRFMVLLNKLAWIARVTWLRSFNIHWNVFFLSNTERGTPYVVEQQLRFLKQSNQLLHVRFIHLIGTEDRYVSPVDTVEILPLAQSWYIELPGLSHFDIVNPDQIGISGAATVDAWRETMERVLLANNDGLRKLSISGDHIDDYVYQLDLPVASRVHEEVRDVVILLHGVRDDGFWTKRIGAKIKSGREKTVRTPTPSYGFFSVLNFLSIFARKSKVRWFLEMYLTLKVHYPKSDISFVGHSNGTYLAVQAMKLCKSVRFKRMYFAGSVVRTDFNWCDHDEQVSEKVVNVVNSNDFVISTSPGFIEDLGWSFLNIGGAGQLGFKKECLTSKVENFGPFARGHSGAISRDYWPAISAFINGGDFNPPEPVTRLDSSVRVKVLRAICLIVLAALLLSFCALVVFILTKMTKTAFAFTLFWIALIWAARNV